MSGCSGPAVTPVCCHRCFLRLDDAFTLPVTTWALDDGQLLGQELSIIAPTWTAPLSYAHTAAPVGRGPSPLGVAANPGPSVDMSFTASCAAPTGRVPGLRGAFIIASTPCSCVGVGETNIAVLLDCSSRLDSVGFLTYLLENRNEFYRNSCMSYGPQTRTHQLGRPIYSGRYHSQFFVWRAPSKYARYEVQEVGRDQRERAIPGQPIFIGHPTYVRPRRCWPRSLIAGVMDPSIHTPEGGHCFLCGYGRRSAVPPSAYTQE